MRIILNPPVGAPIQNVYIRGKQYFVEPFEVDTMVKFEDDGVADDLMGLYEFLVPFTPEEAKDYKEDQAKRTFKCDKCDYKTTTQILLDKHVAGHLEEEKLDKELGIQVIQPVEKVEAEEEVTPQDAIDQLARSQGLDYGEGAVIEGKKKKGKF